MFNFDKIRVNKNQDEALILFPIIDVGTPIMKIFIITFFHRRKK